MQDHTTPLLEVKLQRPILMRTLGGDDDDGKLEEDHKRDKKVGVMVPVRFVGTTMTIDFSTKAPSFTLPLWS